jgi:hypothetical protein
MLYFERDQVCQVLQKHQIQAVPMDGGLVWVTLLAQEPSALIPGTLVERNYNLVQLIFPKAPWAYALDKTLRDEKFMNPRLGYRKEQRDLILVVD